MAHFSRGTNKRFVSSHYLSSSTLSIDHHRLRKSPSQSSHQRIIRQVITTTNNNMKSSIAFIVSLVTIALAEAGTNKTLAPTPGASRPPDTEPPVVETQPPITPFPTEATITTPAPVEVPETSPPVEVPTPPTYTVSSWSLSPSLSLDIAILVPICIYIYLPRYARHF